MTMKPIELDWTYLEERMESILARELSEDAIDDAIAKYAQSAIEDAIASEIRIFYTVEGGRDIIKDAVIKRLNLHGETKL